MKKVAFAVSALALGAAALVSDASADVALSLNAIPPASGSWVNDTPWLSARIQHWQSDILSTSNGSLLDAKVTTGNTHKLFNTSLNATCKDVVFGTTQSLSDKKLSVKGNANGDIRLTCPTFLLISKSSGKLDAI